jgi:hypothetical protein
MAVDYLVLLRDLVEERQQWICRREEADRQLSRLSEIIRSTVKMLTPEQRCKYDCDTLLERIDNRPPGLTILIRGAFTASGKDWLTPVEIRDCLKNTGAYFEKYKANPLASIHTTLKRMVPHEAECKAVDGQKAYRLKTVEQWRSSIAEARQWMADLKTKRADGTVVALAVAPGHTPTVLPLESLRPNKQGQKRNPRGRRNTAKDRDDERGS